LLLAGCSASCASGPTTLLVRISAPDGVQLATLSASIATGAAPVSKAWDHPSLPASLIVELPAAELVTVVLDASDTSGAPLHASGTTQAPGELDLALAYGAVGPDAGIDLGPGADLAPPLPCNKTTLVADDFCGATMSTLWGASWADPDAGLQQQNCELDITPPTNLIGYAGYLTDRYFDLTGSQVQVEVKQMLDPTSSADAQLHLNGLTGDLLEIIQESGTLYFRRWLGGTDTELANAAWDPVAMRWWRIRESGGTTFYETSPDGAAWVKRASEPNAPFVRFVRVELSAGAWQAEATPGSFHVDALNGGAATGIYCPAAQLSDDFSATSIGPQWHLGYQYGGCMRTQGNGQATAAIATGSECGWVSSSYYDLRGSSLFAEIAQLPNTTSNAYAWLQATADSSDRVEILERNGNLIARQIASGTYTVLASIPIDTTAHRWWRLREAGGTTFWETAPDGKTWTVRASAANPIALGRVSLNFGAGAGGAVQAPGSATFAHLNVAPP
jgi:hypothetical protein